MANLHIAAIHDRIDEEHFELRLHANAIEALQRRVLLLEAAIRDLCRQEFGPALNGHLPGGQTVTGGRKRGGRQT